MKFLNCQGLVILVSTSCASVAVTPPAATMSESDEDVMAELAALFDGDEEPMSLMAATRLREPIERLQLRAPLHGPAARTIQHTLRLLNAYQQHCVSDAFKIAVVLPELPTFRTQSSGAELQSVLERHSLALKTIQVQLKHHLLNDKTVPREVVGAAIAHLEQALDHIQDRRPLFAAASLEVAFDEWVGELGDHRAFLREDYLPAAQSAALHHLFNPSACYQVLLEMSGVRDGSVQEAFTMALEVLDAAKKRFPEGSDSLVAEYQRDRPSAPDSMLLLDTAVDRLRHHDKVAALIGAVPVAPLMFVNADARQTLGPIAMYRRASASGPATVSIFSAIPRWQIEAVAIHEGIPGHHLHLSRLGPLTPTASPWVEGWAVYVSALAEELGLYSSESARLGARYLAVLPPLWAAVDLGLHAMSWGEPAAVEFIRKHLHCTEHEARQEFKATRSVSPGAALRHLTGYLTLTSLRAYAEQKLGPRFDLKSFHGAVLRMPAYPLHIADSQMRAWVDSQ